MLAWALSAPGAGASTAHTDWKERVDTLSALAATEPKRAFAGMSELVLEVESLFEGTDAPPDGVKALHALTQVSSLFVDYPSFVPADWSVTEHLATAMELAHRVERADMQSLFASNWMRFLEAQSGVPAALAVMEEALVDLPLEEPRRADLLVRGGKIALAAGAIGQAEELAGRALEELERVDPDWNYFAALACGSRGLLAEIAIQMGLPDQALVHAGIERQLAEEAGNAELLQIAIVHEIDATIAADRPKPALALIEAALAEGGAVKDPARRAELRFLTGASQAFLGYEERPYSGLAREALEEAVDEEDLTADSRAKARGWLAELARREGDLERARRVLAWNEEDADSAPSIVVALHLTLKRAQAQSREEVQAIIDLGRAHIERSLKRQAAIPPRPGGLGYSHGASTRLVLQQILSALLDLHPGQEGVERCLEDLFRTQAAGSFARRAGYNHRTLAEVRTALTGPKRGVLVYLPSAERSHVIAFDSKRAVHALLPGFETIRTLRRDHEAALHRALRRPDVTSLDTAGGAALSQALLPTDIAELVATWDAASIVGLDILGYIPFALLPFEDGLLGNELALTVLPSIPVGMVLADRSQMEPPATGAASGGDLWTLAAPDLDEDRGLPPIPFGAAERARLARVPDDCSTHWFTGSDATYAALLSPGLSTSSVLHVLTHGVRRAEAPTAGLLLAAGERDRAVWSEDIETLAVPPVVVLSVCSAARGTLRRGDDDQMGLASAFLRAGAQVVLLARGDLEYRACLDLVESFQQRLLVHGDTVDEALRHARTGLMQDGRNRHASYQLMHAVGLGGVRLR